MSRFGVALAAAMGEAGWNQSDLKERAKVSQGQISTYLNENGHPDGPALTRICKAFGENHAAPLVSAWLRDQIPELSELLEIRTRDKSARVREDDPGASVYQRLPRKVRRVVDEVAEKCEADPRFLAAIQSTLNLTKR